MITQEQIREKFLTGEYKNENQFAAACYQYAWNAHPGLRYLLFHVKNELDRIPGEKQSNYSARLALAAAMGVVPGIPDHVYVGDHVCGIELKTLTGTLSPKQKELHQLWYTVGRPVYVCRTAEAYAEVVDCLASGQPVPDTHLSPAITPKN